jgi:hypothetical protein
VLDQILAWVASDGATAQTTPLAPDYVLHGLHTDYTVALTPNTTVAVASGGTVAAASGTTVAVDPVAVAPAGAVIVDTVHGRDGTRSAPLDHDLVFIDGIGRLDATGNAEDCGRLYLAAFDRSPDPEGLRYWTTRLDTGTLGLGDVAAAFVASSEFSATYGTLGNAGFVERLYMNVLGRPADSAGLQHWTGALGAGLGRNQVLAAVASSFEHKVDTLPTIGDRDLGRAYRLYQAAFNRTPDADGLRAWTTALDQGTPAINVAEAFASSDEFSRSFSGLDTAAAVGRLYVNVFHRVGDAGGVQYWARQLGVGATYGQVLLGFADSLENRIGTAAATHDGWLFLA